MFCSHVTLHFLPQEDNSGDAGYALQEAFYLGFVRYLLEGVQFFSGATLFFRDL